MLGNITARGCTPPSSGIVDPYGKNFSSVDPAIWSTCTATNTPLEVFQVNATDKYAVFNVVNAGEYPCRFRSNTANILATLIQANSGISRVRIVLCRCLDALLTVTTVSIDSHPFYVLSADGNYVQPILTNVSLGRFEASLILTACHRRLSLPSASGTHSLCLSLRHPATTQSASQPAFSSSISLRTR